MLEMTDKELKEPDIPESQCRDHALFYAQRLQPKLKRIERLARRGKSRAEIATRIGVSLSTLRRYAKMYDELNDALIPGIVENKGKVAVSLVQAAIGYEYNEKEVIYDSAGDVVQVKIKTKKQPPNIGAAVRVLKMAEEYHSIDEKLKTAQLRNTEADAKIKEQALAELNKNDAPPIIDIINGLRTIGVNK